MCAVEEIMCVVCVDVTEGHSADGCVLALLLLLLFAMIRSVVKSFKVPDVEVAAARMSNESALTHDLLDTKNNLGQT